MLLNISGDIFEAIRKARSITVLTGAGMSAESGVPTFREAQKGLWAQYDPQELATPQAFHRNAKLVWEWYEWRRNLISRASPNPGHKALKKLEEMKDIFSLVTQNVDNLHKLAGSDNIIELHGNIFRTKCFDNNHTVETWSTDENIPPQCPECGSPLRPDVVWFGESVPSQAFSMAVTNARQCEIFISIGTSSVIQPAASLPYFAQETGALLIEINTEQTPLSPIMDYQIREPAGKILPFILENAFN
jgi:NAD-dependent deacetylase